MSRELESFKLNLRAELYRHGMHSLDPYWSQDADALVDPFKGSDTPADVKRFIRYVFSITEPALAQPEIPATPTKET